MSGLLKPASNLAKRLSETWFRVYKRLPETRQCSYSTVKSVSRNIDSGTAFGKICIISKVSHRSSLNINFLISQELWNKKVKTRSGPEESTNLNFQTLKYNPISGETVPLKVACVKKFAKFSVELYWERKIWRLNVIFCDKKWQNHRKLLWH
jgi:hypothetical protein